jgi:hypothetical protein
MGHLKNSLFRDARAERLLRINGANEGLLLGEGPYVGSWPVSDRRV